MDESFWAMSNITASNPKMLEQFLMLVPTGSDKLTAFDRIVDHCFLSLQEISSNKTVFIESMYVLVNFLTTCSNNSLSEIRNDMVIEILVEALQS